MQSLFPDICFQNQQDSHEVYLRLMGHLECRVPVPLHLSVDLLEYSVHLEHSQLDQVQLFGLQLSYYRCLECSFIQNIAIQKHYLLSIHVNNNKNTTLLQAIDHDYNVNHSFGGLTCICCTLYHYVDNTPCRPFTENMHRLSDLLEKHSRVVTMDNI